MTDRRDNAPPPDDWRPEPHACPFCEINAHHCGCPTGNRITDEAYRAIEEAHITRGSE